MRSLYRNKPITTLALLIWITLSFIGCQSCGISQRGGKPTLPIASTPIQQLPEADVVFKVILPADTPQKQPISLDILDEVTGSALTSKSYEMRAQDDVHYTIKLSLPVGTTLKYRYSRQGIYHIEEQSSDKRPIRYRLYYVDGPGLIEDIVSAWSDTTYNGPTGRIIGHTIDAKSGSPIPGLFISAGGKYSLTASDGSFLLEGLLPGTHNLVAYALDGTYHTFQQGAMVASESATPAEISLYPAPLITINFTVSVPSGTLASVPIRMGGNFLQLGNTFAGFSGGLSTIASRMPVLSSLPDGRYKLTISLPAGADFYYKYTLGDGFWNSEHSSAGDIRLRHLIIPDNNLNIEDTIEAWGDGKKGPVIFSLIVPESTPATDTISIQFNPSGWTEPIPMWSLGNNQWAYVLFGPFSSIDKMGYRYCRNDQCGSADDILTMGEEIYGRPLTLVEGSQTINDTVDGWAWLEVVNPPIVSSTIIQARGAEFMAGIETQHYFHPSWNARMPEAFREIRELSANWVILTPSWSYTQISPPVLEPIPGVDPLWSDTIDEIKVAHSMGLKTALFPTPHISLNMDEWWTSAPRDFTWWLQWFDRYRNFILNYADLAQQQGTQALILGGDWITPALPGVILPGGLPSGVPADAELRWRNLIAEIRTHFQGTILWAFNFSDDFKNVPPFLDAIDQIYLLWSPPLSNRSDALESALHAEASRLLDERVLPFYLEYGNPIILAISYPSADGSMTSCLSDPLTENGVGCLNPDLLSRPYPDLPSITVDLAEQAGIYNAILLAVNERPFISGVVSRGYYLPALLIDKSSSVHGKPAGNVLWYWFPRLLGIPTP